MKIKNLIAGMLTVVMLTGPGTMTCYAAGSSEADAVSVNAASTEETADSAAAKEAPAVSQKGEESKAAETTGNHAADGAAENNEEAQNEEKSYTVTVDENGNTVYSIGDWKWSCEQSDESASSGIVNDKVRSYLHLRSGSGMEYDIIGHLLPGEGVQVVGEDGEWYQVVVPEKTGYVSKDYLKVLEKEKNDGNIDQECMETMLGLMMESMEDEKSSAPLTPDGNMTLVDDIGSSTGAGKQFITLVTKNGNYFYLIIDRDDKGEETVHFLNLVDEQDLFSLMEDDQETAYQNQLAAEQAEKEAEEATASASTAETEDGDKDKDTAATTEKAKSKAALLLIIPLILAAAGGGWFYLQNKKKKTQAPAEDPDAGYLDEDDDEEDYGAGDEGSGKARCPYEDEILGDHNDAAEPEDGDADRDETEDE